MPNSKNSFTKRLFIDYIPAELKQTAGNDWRVVYYVKIPGQEKLKRFRKRVPPLKNKSETRKRISDEWAIRREDQFYSLKKETTCSFATPKRPACSVVFSKSIVEVAVSSLWSSLVGCATSY